MPELPEVETVRATLEPVLTGRTITHIDITLPRLIKNATVEAFQRLFRAVLLLPWGVKESICAFVRTDRRIYSFICV